MGRAEAGVVEKEVHKKTEDEQTETFLCSVIVLTHPGDEILSC